MYINILPIVTRFLNVFGSISLHHFLSLLPFQGFLAFVFARFAAALLDVRIRPQLLQQLQQLQHRAIAAVAAAADAACRFCAPHT